MYGRIPDEKKMFEVGDQVSYEGQICTVLGVSDQQVYYEHRPIASYKAYLYRVELPDGTTRILELEQLDRESD